ncbi:MAG: TIGR01459 family HAD-type hydrolase [Rhodospirillales bacterium]
MASPLLPGIAALAERYDGFVLDLWGVIHDGRQVFPWVNETLTRLKQAGKRIVLLSNAPRRVPVTWERNASIGLDNSLVDGLMTSGEAAWQHLTQRPDAFYQGLGRRCLHIGGARDISARDGLDYDFVTTAEEADFLFNTGSSHEDGRPSIDEAPLQAAAVRGLPMVCANPDKVVIVGGRMEECAGAIAQRYEALGGQVRYHGKPHAEVYGPVMEMLDLPKARCLAVGDSFATDIRGAANAGLDALFVVDGIHRDDLDPGGSGSVDEERLAALCEDFGVRPVAAVHRLVL